ncbi:MAG: NYN domain-containing protein [Phycisphaerales bacterium]|nr:NYN domain-containing protein [Phycisphaerales bacterium]
MGLLIDTANVLHQTGVLPPDLAGVGLRGLGALIKGSRWGAERVTLVCDGAPRGPHAGLPTGMHAVFSGHGATADDLIEARIAASNAPRTLTVVSSDRRIIKAARKRRCRSLTSEAFLRTLVTDAQRRRKAAPPRPSRVDLPTDLIAEAQAMADAHGGPTPPQATPQPSPPGPPKQSTNAPTSDPPPAEPLDESPLPKSIIEEARRLLGEG